VSWPISSSLLIRESTCVQSLTREHSWAGHYTRAVFPGGALPTVTLLVSSLARATAGRLVVDSISNIGPHYARTLREWRRRFVGNFAEIEQALRKDHPGVFDSEQGADELAVFRRKWLCKSLISIFLILKAG
jgi:cyclopropane fatty-acyl-phospholipid synthase-like methyltransferase